MDKFIKRSAALLASAAALLFANAMFGSDELSGSFSVSAETAAEQSITQQQDSNTDTDKQGENSQPDKQEASKTEDGDSEQTCVYGISAAETSIDKALIVWEDSDRFELYSVYAAKEGEEPKLVAQTTDDCVTFSGLEPDTSYIFSVQASSGDEVYDFGSVYCKTKGIETLSVDDLYAVSDYNSIALSWSEYMCSDTFEAVRISNDHINYILNYDVYLKDENGVCRLLTSTTKNSAVLEGLSPETSYTFVVNGRSGDKTTKSVELTAKTLSYEDVTVANVKAKADLDCAEISWDKLDHAKNYRVYQKISDGEYKVIGITTKTNFKAKGLEPDTDYCFVVRANNGEKLSKGGKTEVSTKSFSSLSIKGIKAKADLDCVEISWKKLIYAKDYRVYQKLSDGEYKLIGITAETNFKAEGLVPDTAYCFVVRANNGEKLSKGGKTEVSTKSFSSISIKGIKSKASLDSVALSWNELTLAKSYKVFLQNADGSLKLIKTTSKTSVVITKLSPDSSYTFAVKGCTNGKLTKTVLFTAGTLKSNVNIKFEHLNQLGGSGNSGKVKATYGCGGTSTTMLLNAKGLNLNKDTVLKRQYANGWDACFCPLAFPYAATYCGSVMSNLKDLAASYGFTPKVNTSPKAIDIMRVLDGGDLVLVGLRTPRGAYHFQIIYGYYIINGVTNFRMQDPYGNTCYDWTQSYLLQRIYSIKMDGSLCAQVRGIMWLK